MADTVTPVTSASLPVAEASKMSRSALIRGETQENVLPLSGNKLGMLAAKLRGGKLNETEQNDEQYERDSFGQVIRPADYQVQADSTPLPQFQNGMLTSVGQTAVNTAMMTTETPSEDPEAERQLAPRDPAPQPEKKTSGVIISIVCVILVIAVGVAIYWLWYRLNLQIINYRRQAETAQQVNQQLQIQISGLQDENKLTTTSLPIYIDPNGYYSFYKDIPSLSVSADANAARIFYGETNGEEPISGFVMIVEIQPTNGRSLETIVNADYDHAPNGVTYVGKRDETIAEHMGFSFVAYQDGKETMHYYLQDAATSKRYAKVTYKIGSANDTEYEYYNRMAIQVMRMLQLYEID